MTSIHPMEYFVKRVGGDLVEVTNLVAPGVEAHAYEPTAGDMQRIGAADLVVMNGLELEPWLGRALRSLGSNAPATVVEAADQNIATLPVEVQGRDQEHGHDDDDHGDGHSDHDDGHHDHGHGHEDHAQENGHGGDDLNHEDDGHDDHGHEHGEFDPHVWLDPLLAVVQVERIRDALVHLAPEHAARFHANADEVVRDLRELHERFESTLSSCVHRHFVTTHAAYAYVAARYGLEQVPIAGLTPEAEPSAQRLAQISDQVRDLGLRHILVEPVFGSRLADTVRRETGADPLPIHQIESVTLAELREHGDYMGLMKNNLRSLSVALECGS